MILKCAPTVDEGEISVIHAIYKSLVLVIAWGITPHIRVQAKVELPETWQWMIEPIAPRPFQPPAEAIEAVFVVLEKEKENLQSLQRVFLHHAIVVARLVGQQERLRQLLAQTATEDAIFGLCGGVVGATGCVCWFELFGPSSRAAGFFGSGSSSRDG
jgi:hypothetical protein